MLLIITDSKDGLINRLAVNIDSKSFFRFNVDIWYKYEFVIEDDYWSLADPLGRKIDSKTKRNILYRKPFSTFEKDICFPKSMNKQEIKSQKLWLISQIRRFVLEIYLLEQYNCNVVLVPPSEPIYNSKTVQMKVASKYFDVPKFKIFWSNKDTKAPKNFCAKSLSQFAFEGGRYLFTKELKENDLLKAGYPWFIQKKIDSPKDLTVLYIKGDCYSFYLDRKQISGLDWRSEIYSNNLVWKEEKLNKEVINKINNFMQDMGLDFGRIDFLLDENEELWFLEVNSNGEWGWLNDFYKGDLFSVFLDKIKKN